MTRKKCLLLSYVTPRTPGGGGEVRSFHLVHAATTAFEVTLLNLGGTTGSGVVADQLRQLCKDVIEPQSQPIQEQRPKRQGRLSSWLNLVTANLFPWVDDYGPYLNLIVQHATSRENRNHNRVVAILRRSLQFWSYLLPIPPTTCFMFDASWRRIEHSARQLLNNQKFDVIWIEHTLTWPFAERLLRTQSAHPIIICSSHNVESVVCKRLQDAKQTSPMLDYYETQRRLMERMELKAWKQSDLIIQCSETDANITRQTAPGKEVVVIPNGVDTAYFQKSNGSVPAPNPTILFTAGFGYHPNIEAVEWFLSEVFPVVLSTLPTCKFVFAGSEAASLYERLRPSLSSHSDSIECVSDPADIRPCFEKAWVYVVPLRYGGGTRLKILEAISMRVPVVSTTVGAEGIPYINGKHLLLADTPREFAQAIINLLGDQQRREEISLAATEFVTLNYDWQKLSQQLLQILKQHCH